MPIDSPLSLRAHQDRGLLEIAWTDGTRFEIPFHTLRCECPCASCIHEITGQRMLNPADVSESVCPTGMDLVGNYALKIVWSDGHSTGIFTWERLRSIGDSIG